MGWSCFLYINWDPKRVICSLIEGTRTCRPLLCFTENLFLIKEQEVAQILFMTYMKTENQKYSRRKGERGKWTAKDGVSLLQWNLPSFMAGTCNRQITSVKTDHKALKMESQVISKVVYSHRNLWKFAFLLFLNFYHTYCYIFNKGVQSKLFLHILWKFM